MPTPELGRIETVEVRDVWEYEDDDFTPWLASNLGVLGEALGMVLEEVRQEAPVGSFSLDILAREVGRGVYVAIENQLERTDHGHLGQLLTYAAGYDARVVVWVTPRFQDEHRAAIDWLNRWTPEEIEFYGVQVRAIKIGDSLPAPEFRPVAFPNGWTKEKQSASSGLLPSSRQFRDFFQPLVDELRRAGFTDQAKVYARSYQNFPSRFAGIHYGICFYYRPDVACVYVSITTGDKEDKQVFEALQRTASDIQAGIDGELEWRRNDSYTFSTIDLRTDGSIDDPQEKLDEIRAWMLEHLPKLKAVLDPHLKRVLNELQPEGADDADAQASAAAGQR